MKRTLTAMVVILALVLATTSCGSAPVDPLKAAYPTYGVFNEDTNKSQNVCYKMSAVSVIVSIIFIETVFIPVYFVGWDLWEPSRMKTSPTDNCGLGR